ncbi:hypothetical protein AHAS_Ahas06G0000900 [Arachis hypogaea]
MQKSLDYLPAKWNNILFNFSSPERPLQLCGYNRTMNNLLQIGEKMELRLRGRRQRDIAKSPNNDGEIWQVMVRNRLSATAARHGEE